jgi:hypothetical protein
MEQKTLKLLRIIVPGLVLILAMFPLLLSFAAVKSSFIQYQSLIIAFLLQIEIVLGVFYHILDFRGKHWRKDLDIIHTHIKRRIIEILSREPGFDTKRAENVSDKKYLNVHYKLIDKDESLKFKGQLVFLNGVIFTSLIDLRVILLPLSAVYFLLFLFRNLIVYPITAMVFLIIVLLVWPLRRLVRKRHLKLIDDQIDFYNQYYHEELLELVKSSSNG